MSLKLDCLKWFTQSKSDPEKWECKCGKTFRRKLNTGWTNLHQHIVKQHSEENKNDPKQPKIETLTTKSYDIYCWLDWICGELKPFSFVDSEYTRKYTNLNPITRTTFMKYLKLVTEKCEKEIAKELPNKFAIAFDGWSSHGEHYVGVFAIIPNCKPN